jgi:hypothetical protein
MALYESWNDPVVDRRTLADHLMISPNRVIGTTRRNSARQQEPAQVWLESRVSLLPLLQGLVEIQTT